MKSKEEIIASPEWQALNRLYKGMTKQQREALGQEFQLLSAFIKENVGRGDPATEYLDELSPAARAFIKARTAEGEPNLYRRFLSLIGGSVFEKPEEAMAYYLLRFSRNQPYLTEHKAEVEEILALAWKHQLAAGFRPGEGF